jgi:hypothetical protein
VTTSHQARTVMQGEERLGPQTSMGELTNGVVDLVKSSRRSDTKACHAMDQGSTHEEVNEMDEVLHRLPG